MTIVLSKKNLLLARDLQAMTGETVMLCYHSKQCTVRCPSAYTMRMRPYELTRAISISLWNLRSW